MKNKRIIIIFSAITLLLFVIAIALGMQIYSKDRVITEKEERISKMENQISKLRDSYRNVTPTQQYPLSTWKFLNTSDWGKIEESDHNISYLCPKGWSCKNQGPEVTIVFQNLDKKAINQTFSITVDKIEYKDIANTYYSSLDDWYKALLSGKKKATVSKSDINAYEFFTAYDEETIEGVLLDELGERKGLAVKINDETFELLLPREDKLIDRLIVSPGKAADYSLIMTIVASIEEQKK